MNAPTIAALLTYPLRGQGGVLLVAWSVVFYLLQVLLAATEGETAARWIALMVVTIAAVITLGVFLLYGWLTLRHATDGNLHPIASVEVEEVHPFMNYLGLQVAALSMVVAAMTSAALDFNVVLGAALITLGVLALPAVLGVMILDRRFVAGLDPSRVAAFLRSLGADYVGYALVLYAGMAALYGACTVAPNLIIDFVASYGFVLAHMIAGRALHGHEDPEVAVAPKPDDVSRRIESLMVELHRLCGVDRLADADRRLEEFLSAEGHALDDQLHTRLATFHDRRLLLAHSWRYIDRLLAANKTGRAWRLLCECLALDAQFRPSNADALLRMIAVAPIDAGDAVGLLEDFERAYPDSDQLPRALSELARRLG